MAEKVADLVRSMNDPVLVGHSLGGHLCMRVLAQVKNVRALVLFGSPPLSGAADLARAFQPAPALAKAFQAVLTQKDAKELATAYTWAENPRIQEMARLILAADPRVRSGIGAQMATGNLVNEQELIRNGPPVCMVHGAVDAFIPLTFLEAIAHVHFWQDRIYVLPDAGHSPQIQQPRGFNSILDHFIRAISA